MVKGKPARYDFLPELAATPVQQVSVETAQPSLDCSVLAELAARPSSSARWICRRARSSRPETVAARIRRALPYVDAERVIVAPDCGLKYLTREVAFGKMQAMVQGAGLVRAELQSSVAARA